MLEINRWTDHHTISIPLINLLPNLKEANFYDLEIWQYHISSLSEDALKKLSDKLQELEMTVSAVGAYVNLQAMDSEAVTMDLLINKMVSSSAVLGSKIFKIIPGNLASHKVNLPMWNHSVRRIKELANKLADNGMDLSLETHFNSLCDTEESTLRLMQDLSGIGNVGICYQPFDEQNTEQAMATFSRLYTHVIHIHLQNLPDKDAETTTFLESGGWMDYSRLIPHYKKSGYDGVFCLEFTEGIFPPKGEKFNPQTVIDNAKKDREFFLKLWKS